jgi:hypothetical protein
MARCSNSNKFEPETLNEEGDEQGLEVDESGHVTASVRALFECEGCGNETREYLFDLEGDIDIDPEDAEHWKSEGDHGVEASCDAWQVGEHMQATVRSGKSKGKPITRARYQTRMISVEGEVKLTCSCGADLGTVTLSDETNAGSFESLEH